jgi:hypothetical protein
LAIPRVLDLDPVTRRFLRYLVRRVLPLAYDSFQIHFDDFYKQQPAIAFDVIEVKHSRAFAPDQFLQDGFSFNQREGAQVFSIQIQQIKCGSDLTEFPCIPGRRRWDFYSKDA